jgi:hypothetical protein
MGVAVVERLAARVADQTMRDGDGVAGKAHLLAHFEPAFSFGQGNGRMTK